MAFILIIASLVLFLWIVSLCKVLLLPRIPFAKHFTNNNGRAFRKRNVLLVIAHPDDESMFFTPTINFLTSKGHNVQILCLSIGDADGKGNIRKQELFQACVALKVPMQQVKIVNHPDLQDGFGKVWNHSLLAKIIEEEITSRCIDMVRLCCLRHVSADQLLPLTAMVSQVIVIIVMCIMEYGKLNISIDQYQRTIAEKSGDIVSTNILRKYSGPVDIWLSIFLTMLHTNGTMQCLVNEHSRRSGIAMAQHSSQWVWFRKLFVTLSSYTYMNTLRKVK
ncbi:putative N-acetylglucosaminyl-phosphatidylinositol de-N-acetylase [Glycine max]|nr:putative N-acetylglucosaminyl-phosphatidylinositol de-N-acetylase [Glycine max]